MTSVGRKLGLPFRGKGSTKKKSCEQSRDELEPDHEAYIAYRKGSIGSVVPPSNLSVPSGLKPGSKSNSMGSISGDLDGGLEREDIVSLTHDVRSFSDALANLKNVFNGEQNEDGEPCDMKVAAHKELGEVLCILKDVLAKYNRALNTTEILVSAAMLITKIKSCNYDDVTADVTDIQYTIDQLALAFSSSVSEYLMGDVETYPQLNKTKSFDNLMSNSEFGSTDNLRDGVCLSNEEIDATLMRIESGVDVALQRAKVWAKYAKDVIAYVEKRTQLELEFSKNLAKLASGVRQTITEESYLPFQSIYCTALDHDLEYSSTTQTSATLIQTSKFIEPLNNRRLEHEKNRKAIKEVWSRETRRMHECIASLRKTRSIYVQRQQEYEKARENAQRADADNLSTSTNSSLISKVDKKRRLEEDAMHRAIEAETTYKACVIEANNRQQELERVKNEVLSGVRDLIVECDHTMKSVTVAYFQLQHAVSAPLHVQYQTLCESSQQYEPGAQYAEYVRHLPVPSMTNPPEPFLFEPFTPETRAYNERKPSTQSSGSGSSDLHDFANESPSPARPNEGKGARGLKGWGQGSDSESISGSSSRSRESSPSASPYQQHRYNPLPNSESMNELAEADRDQQFDSRVVSGIGVSYTTPSIIQGVSYTRAAKTHAFVRLRAPSRCRACDGYVFSQGAQCQKCGISCHRKCLETLQFECGKQNSLERRMTTFGVDFNAHVQETHTVIPHLVRKCTCEIEQRGLQTKGIYRVSGVKSKVEKLCQSFEIDEGNVDLSEHNPNVIANVLKLYLRQLPEPLLTFHLYTSFINLAKEEPSSMEETLERLKALINQLPKANFRTCALLMHHLNRVANEEETNQMSASNLGIVFGPTLLRPSEGAASLNSLMDTTHQTRIIELLISTVETIFGPDEHVSEAPSTSASSLPTNIELDKTQTSSGDCVDGAVKSEGADGEATSPKWFVLETTESLKDELAREDPRFQQVADECVNLPGSIVPTETEAEETDQTAKSASAEEATPQPDLEFGDCDLPDSLLPDGSSPCASSHHAASSSSSSSPASLSVDSSPSSSSHSSPTKMTAAKGAENPVTYSPGLRRRLLPSDLRKRPGHTPKSTFYTSSSADDLDRPPSSRRVVSHLSKPQQYSPPTIRASHAFGSCENILEETSKEPVRHTASDPMATSPTSFTNNIAQSTFYTPSVVVTREQSPTPAHMDSSYTSSAKSTPTLSRRVREPQFV